MKVLVTGTGKSGSWLIRGEQLGRAIGASVVPNAGNVHGHDVVVLIKRPPDHTIEAAHSSRAKVVWDIVDAWPQPIGNLWDRVACLSWLDTQLRRIKPHAVVAATQRMADDVKEFGLPAISLPHHARPNMRHADIRPTISRVGYEGSLRHLGLWEARLRSWCISKGIEFCPNPEDLASLDVVVAMREARGYAPVNWKSNVKLANAQAVGLPMICNREFGYLETGGPEVLWADDIKEFTEAMSQLRDQDFRRKVSTQMLANTIHQANVANTYKSWLRSLI